MTKRYKSRRRNNQQFFLWGGTILVVIIILGVWVSGQTTLPLAISVDEAAEKRDQGAFILDVRMVEEWEEHHIPDSTLIPLEELPGRLSEVPRDMEIVIVCRTGNRSQEGRDILLDAGFEQVTSMNGGIINWETLGYPTVKGP
jgi:rhodanese-related sulfurtransferase